PPGAARSRLAAGARAADGADAGDQEQRRVPAPGAEDHAQLRSLTIPARPARASPLMPGPDRAGHQRICPISRLIRDSVPGIGQETCRRPVLAGTLGPMPASLPLVEADLVRHVIATTGLPPATATKVIADVVAYFDETVEDYVRRRHHELRLRQLKNAQIWSVITGEISTRRFAAPVMTERQLRRIVYGWICRA